MLLVLTVSSALAGRVQTLDRRPLEGNLRTTNGALVVISSNSIVATVFLTNLLTASFDDQDVSGPAATGTGLGLLGYYFPTTDGRLPPFVRLDETIDFNWADNPPVPGLPQDLFAVTWSGEIEPPVSGPYTFFVSADDTVSLFLTNQVLVQASGRREPGELASPRVPLEAGQRYAIRLAYADHGGAAGVRLLWTAPDLPKAVIPRARLHPTGLGAGHTAQVNTNQGLLATYYSTPDFGGTSFTRIDPVLDFDWSNQDPAPGISRTNFSVRWTGRIRAEHTEEFTFYVTTDEPVRFWIDQRLLMDRPEQGWLSESKETVPLVAGEQYDVRLETKSTGGGAIARLFWSSGSITRTNVPASHQLPSRPTPKAGAPPEDRDKTPAGVVLRNGSLVAGEIQHASPTSLRLTGRLKDRALSAVNVARIICQPLPAALAPRLSLGRTGVLLTKGDFVDGDFRSLENGRLSLSSVLFGVRTFDVAKEVLVVALRDVYPSTATFELRLRDQSVILPRALQLDGSGFSAEDTLLGVLRFGVEEVRELRRR